MTNTQPSCLKGREPGRIPNTFKGVMDLPQVARWKAVSDKEITSLEKDGVFELILITSVPGGHKVVGNGWVFKIKADSTYKGRHVVQGLSQIPGIDCGGTFASVCRLQIIRMMRAFSAELDYKVHMLDMQTAFLNTNVEEDVFVKMAPGYETNGKAGLSLVMKLKKSLYGLRQSPKNCFGTMDVELAIIGFRPFKSDPCMYNYESDEPFQENSSKTLLNKFKKQLMGRFEMSNMCDMSRILGMNVTLDRKKGAITISEKDYTEDVVQRYGMEGCNPAYTPGVGPELSLNQPEEKRRYQAITRAVMYLAQVTRYDILYAVIQLVRAMSKPAKAHMGAAKHRGRVRSVDPTGSEAKAETMYSGTEEMPESTVILSI